MRTRLKCLEIITEGFQYQIVTRVTPVCLTLRVLCCAGRCLHGPCLWWSPGVSCLDTRSCDSVGQLWPFLSKTLDQPSVRIDSPMIENRRNLRPRFCPADSGALGDSEGPRSKCISLEPGFRNWRPDEGPRGVDASSRAVRTWPGSEAV